MNKEARTDSPTDNKRHHIEATTAWTPMRIKMTTERDDLTMAMLEASTLCFVWLELVDGEARMSKVT